MLTLPGLNFTWSLGFARSAKRTRRVRQDGCSTYRSSVAVAPSTLGRRHHRKPKLVMLMLIGGMLIGIP